ncbi:hypothetical protein Y032_0019g3863 [Ancylostoma ceylanicum]|uniref:SCP domain-containing protein n=1 Tax=Ancylostoma ceylanicum TaxID=53326 RepID=A0A016V460_9BILA|nr:hypothetical protein Y032_0019g3863 [Ancylostoma ceylanicum]
MAAFLSVCIILFAFFESLQAQGNATTAAPTRPPWPKPNCGNPLLTNSLRNLILNLHNNFRGSVARGQTEVSAGWGIAPPATIMYRMKYDCNAESYAQQAVSTCRKTELPAGSLGGHKQNIHVLNTVSTTPEGAAQNAIATWWSQLARFGMRSNMMFYQSEFQRGNQNVLSWSKMAWWNNQRVGCSVQRCSGYYVTSCMYSPGGNNVNQYVYRVGAVCSDCPADTNWVTPGNLSDAYNSSDLLAAGENRQGCVELENVRLPSGLSLAQLNFGELRYSNHWVIVAQFSKSFEQKKLSPRAALTCK